MKYHAKTCARTLILATCTVALLASCTPKSKKLAADPVDGSPEQVLSDSFEPGVKVTPELQVGEGELEKAGQESLTPEEEVVLNDKFGIEFDLDLHESKEVEQYFAYFTHKRRDMFQNWLKRAEPYLPYVRKVLDDHDMPQDLVLLPFVESGYNVKAYSHAHAAGMWQFIRGTGRRYGLTVDWWIDERRDPYLATEAAVRYLSELHEMFGDWYLALAAYNAGEGKIKRALEITKAQDFFELSEKNRTISSHRRRLRTETKHYVPKFIAISKIYQNLEELGFDAVSWDKAPDLVHAKVAGGTDLMALAQSCNMSWAEFHSLNPAFRRQVSPPHKSATVHIPAVKQQKLMAFLADPGSRPYAGYKQYRVRSGDCWSIIAGRYGVPVSVLKQVNNRRSNLLRPGETLMIPGGGSSGYVASASAPAVKNWKGGTYKVRSGDSLWIIANRYGTSVNQLKKINKLRSTRLRVGQKLYVPGNQSTATASASYTGSSYKVRSGDSLWTIAKGYGVSVSELKKANNLSSSRLRAGQTLTIPGKDAATVAKAESRPAPVKTVAAAKSSTPETTREIAQSRANYKVRSGDTLWSISRRYDVSVKTLVKANGLRNKSSLKVGQKLYIPDSAGQDAIATRKAADSANQKLVQYKVRSGDNLWSISRRFGVSTNDLKKWNGLDGKTIHPGDSLKVYVR